MSLYTWHKVELLLDQLEESKPTETTTGSKRVGLLKRDGKVYAFAALCPHAGAPMCEGWQDGTGKLVCPKHKYRFDPTNGRNTSGEGYKLFTYPVEVRENEVFVGLMG